jgi:hypothetical protein
MRKAWIFLTAAVLVLGVGAAVRAEDGPTGVDTPSSAPGSEPVGTKPSQPEPVYAVGADKLTLRVDGKVVDAAPPGVEVGVTITLHNYWNETVRDVKAHLSPSESVRVVDADADYGDIAAGEGADGAFAIVVPREGCPDFLGLGGEVTYDGKTGPLKVEVPTACPGPRLTVYQLQFEGGDGDSVPEPGETLRMFVTLINYGRDAADNVRATIKVSGNGVTTASEELTWPDIAPDRKLRSREAITVKVSDDAKRQDACPGPLGYGGAVVADEPPTDTGTESPDTPVTSDGSTDSSGTASSEPGSSAPGSAGSGSSGSTGTEPTTIEPADRVTSTVEPLTAPAPEETLKPEPAPEPGAPEPAPEQDQPVLVNVHLAISATDYTVRQEHSTGVFCAVAEGVTGSPRKGALSDQPLAARDAGATSSRGSTTLPIVFAVLVSAAAIGTRRALID